MRYYTKYLRRENKRDKLITCFDMPQKYNKVPPLSTKNLRDFSSDARKYEKIDIRLHGFAYHTTLYVSESGCWTSSVFSIPTMCTPPELREAWLYQRIVMHLFDEVRFDLSETLKKRLAQHAAEVITTDSFFRFPGVCLEVST